MHLDSHWENQNEAREFLFRQQQSQDGNTHTVVVQFEWQEEESKMVQKD